LGCLLVQASVKLAPVPTSQPIYGISPCTSFSGTLREIDHRPWSHIIISLKFCSLWRRIRSVSCPSAKSLCILFSKTRPLRHTRTDGSVISQGPRRKDAVTRAYCLKRGSELVGHLWCADRSIGFRAIDSAGYEYRLRRTDRTSVLHLGGTKRDLVAGRSQDRATMEVASSLSVPTAST